jgi:thiamine transport system permease protein
VALSHKLLGRLAFAGAALAPLVFLVLFFAYPLATILKRGLGGSIPTDVWLDRGTVDIVWFTTWQAAVSTIATLAVGLPLAWATARLSFRGRGLVRALVVVPFVLPTVVVATAFLALLPPNLQQGVVPIILAHVFFNVAVVVRVVGGYWGRLDPRLWDAAATLGTSPAQRFRRLTLPALRRPLAAASALTFLFCFTSFGVVVILGGPRYATLEVDIYNLATQSFDLRAAAALSLLQLAAVTAVVVVSSILEGRAGTRMPIAGEASATHRPTRHERVALGAILSGGLLLFGLPLAALVKQSFATPTGAGFSFYRSLWHETPALLVEPWRAVEYSLLYAAAATMIALVVGVLAAITIASARRGARGGFDAVVMLPLGASAVMLGYGFVISFDTSPLEFRDTWWIVPVVQSLVAVPFVVRILVPALRAIDPRLREAAAILGAPPSRVRRTIDAPLLLRPLGVAAGLAFAIALGEFGATVFLARADRPTLPVAIYRFLERPGATNQGTAAALCVVLMAVTALAVAAADRLTARASSV